jgi:hypothetical protein
MARFPHQVSHEPINSPCNIGGGGFPTDDQQSYCYISSRHNTAEQRVKKEKKELREEGINNEK